MTGNPIHAKGLRLHESRDDYVFVQFNSSPSVSFVQINFNGNCVLQSTVASVVLLHLPLNIFGAYFGVFRLFNY